MSRTRLEPGTRVHHRSWVWSRHLGEGAGWGTVLRRVDQADGTAEYEVRADEPVFPGGSTEPRWWASYHLDEWRAPAAAPITTPHALAVRTPGYLAVRGRPRPSSPSPSRR